MIIHQYPVCGYGAFRCGYLQVNSLTPCMESTSQISNVSVEDCCWLVKPASAPHLRSYVFMCRYETQCVDTQQIKLTPCRGSTPHHIRSHIWVWMIIPGYGTLHGIDTKDPTCGYVDMTLNVWKQAGLLNSLIEIDNTDFTCEWFEKSAR